MRVIYDSSKEWVSSLYILRVSETQRIQCVLGVQKATGFLIVEMEIVAFLLNILKNFDFGQNLTVSTVLANSAVEFLSKAMQDLSVFKDAGYKFSMAISHAFILRLTLVVKIYKIKPTGC